MRDLYCDVCDTTQSPEMLALWWRTIFESPSSERPSAVCLLCVCRNEHCSLETEQRLTLQCDDALVGGLALNQLESNYDRLLEDYSWSSMDRQKLDSIHAKVRPVPIPTTALHLRIHRLLIASGPLSARSLRRGLGISSGELLGYLREIGAVRRDKNGRVLWGMP